MTHENLSELLVLARQIGWGAADILLKAEHSDLNIQDAGDGPVTAADLAVNTYILNCLQSQLDSPKFAYLTEETYKGELNHDRLQAPYVWIIDPLDGTKEFIQRNGEYAIHIALVHQHRPILAVVVRPAVGKLYFATIGSGTFLEQRDGSIRPVSVSQRTQLQDLIVVTSRSHRNQQLNQLMEQFPCQQQKSVGSLGGKFAAIAEQDADVYVSISGSSAPKDWDLAAPELILTEAGGQFTHFDGTPLLYNQTDVAQWGGLLASNGHCHQTLCAEASRILAAIADV